MYNHQKQPYIINFRCEEKTKEDIAYIKDHGFNVSSIIRKYLRLKAKTLKEAEENGK